MCIPLRLWPWATCRVGMSLLYRSPMKLVRIASLLRIGVPIRTSCLHPTMPRSLVIVTVVRGIPWLASSGNARTGPPNVSSRRGCTFVPISESKEGSPYDLALIFPSLLSRPHVLYTTLLVFVFPFFSLCCFTRAFSSLPLLLLHWMDFSEVHQVLLIGSQVATAYPAVILVARLSRRKGKS